MGPRRSIEQGWRAFTGKENRVGVLGMDGFRAVPSPFVSFPYGTYGDVRELDNATVKRRVRTSRAIYQDLKQLGGWGMRLRGKVSLVTGGGRGLGQAFCERLAEEGAAVVVASTNKERAQDTVEQVKRWTDEVIYVEMDVAEWDSVKRGVDQAVERFGGVDILVNNAALFSALTRKPFHEIELDEWDRVLEVNLTGPFLCVRAVYPYMKAKGYGKIINVSSGSVFLATNRLAHYVASKMGLIGLTRALAREMGADGICVNTLAPGATDSNSAISTEEYLQAAAEKRSIPRVEKPEDLTGAVAFLASHESDFITGQMLLVDGGGVFH
jgi:3-oxoacyl-[acyl-carrier protein] reductase